jgi:hypothetical protein
MPTIRSRPSGRRSPRKPNASSSYSWKARYQAWIPLNTSRNWRKERQVRSRRRHASPHHVSNSSSTDNPVPTSPNFCLTSPHMPTSFCFLRGLYTDTPAHPQAVVQLHTGSANAALTRPSWGSWLLYGLGTDNQNLPGYITINPPIAFGGAANYGSAFLPAYYQGTAITDQGFMPNIKAATEKDLEREQIDLIQDFNREAASAPGAPDAIDGVIKSYELGFRMQDTVPACSTFPKSRSMCLMPTASSPGRRLIRSPMPDGAQTQRSRRSLR